MSDTNGSDVAVPVLIGFAIGIVASLILFGVATWANIDGRLEDQPKAELIGQMGGAGLFRFVDTEQRVVIYKSSGQVTAVPMTEGR